MTENALFPRFSSQFHHYFVLEFKLEREKTLNDALPEAIAHALVICRASR